jgi:futalosine hydrolase
MNFRQNIILDSKHLNSEDRILIVTAVSTERDAILRGLGSTSRFDVLDVGVGSVAAAVQTAKAMATIKYQLVICAGIGGGFTDRAKIGSLVVADEIVAADLGAQTQHGFCSLDEMGLGSTRFRVDPNLVVQVTEPLREAGLAVITGPVLTLSTVTGTTITAKELVKRVPGAVAEAMEGFGVATVAQTYHVPFLEIRAISNLVGPRDRDKWRIDEALDVLSSASSALGELLG